MSQHGAHSTITHTAHSHTPHPQTHTTHMTFTHTHHSHTHDIHTHHTHTHHSHTHATSTHTQHSHTHRIHTHTPQSHTPHPHTHSHTHRIHTRHLQPASQCVPHSRVSVQLHLPPRPPHLEMRPASPGQWSQAGGQGGGRAAGLQANRCPPVSGVTRARKNISTNTPRQASWKPIKHGKQRTAKAATTSPQSK